MGSFFSLFFHNFVACFFEKTKATFHLMSLPSILKYVYNNASDESIKKGKKIFHTSGVQITEYDTLIGQAIFKVRNDVYANYYKVTVLNYNQPDKLIVRCQCPYNMGAVCRHEAATLFQLNELVQSNFFSDVHIEYDQAHTLLRMRQITSQFVRLFSNDEIFKDAQALAKKKSVEITYAKNEEVHADIKVGKKVFPVVLKQNEERYFDTSCTCEHKEHPLCVHKAALLLFIEDTHGAFYFNTLRNWDAQKNKLLGIYGYSLEDDLSGKFEFYYQEGKPYLKVLDPTIKKATTPSEAAIAAASAENTIQNADVLYRQVGILLNHDNPYYPFINFDLLAGEVNEEQNAFQSDIEKLPANAYFQQSQLRDRDKVVIASLKKIQPDELIKYIKRNSPFGEFMENIGKDLKDKPDQELIYQTYEFYLPRYKKLLDQMSELPLIYYLPKNESFAKKNLVQIRFSAKTFHTHLFVKQLKNKNKQLELQYKIADQTFRQDEVKVLNTALILIDNVLYAANDEQTVKTIAQLLVQQNWEIAAAEWDTYLSDTLLPQIQYLSIDFDKSLKLTVDGVTPLLKLHFSEHDNNLVFKPVFNYHGVDKQWLDYGPAIIAEKGKVVMIERNEAVEQTFLTFLRHAHESMSESRKAAAFIIHADVALKGKWYFSFIEQLQEMQVQIKGYETLKELKINPNKPTTNIQITSGIDWFDAGVEVQFGDNVVKIFDIKKAITNRQSHVKLKDGTLGILTDEWKEQYGLMFKMGTVNKDGQSLRLKQVHFSVIDTMSLEVSNNPSLLQLAEKRDRLNSFDFDKHLEDIALPENVNAQLRPYQQAGFKWFQFLEETSWGGILADDMGLGKTLQTLTFLQSLHNQNPDARFLVVCPTSLMYNWESEIGKFTPSLSYHIHHGSNRNQYDIIKHPVNVLITSYGTLRSDIKKLVEITFDYIVLDESQAIKNPLSQVAKAALILNGKNRIALSGTPIQNNTFDLYAQMNFLNPGMLGSMEFFKSEFATPIDKMQDADAKMHLKKLINPFLLRRTKEQVAPDLPAKSEMIMYCEMGAKQRKIYDAYKNSFRAQILGEIEEKGIERSQMSILTGLTKLRQICDSPAILKNEDYENHSIKIEEIAREMAENMQGHKALVFSQFLGMLHLIKEELEKLKIPYVYFDGSTTSADREKAIQTFQSDDNCRVFLISLKAGGVGLNLTAADYVYLVDPWWNPAVEQQAIDRTHRIGQTKNIFAYRMICKDTIEEKIIKLQERKLGLVKDLISDDNAFLKKLTREDVEYLLS